MSGTVLSGLEASARELIASGGVPTALTCAPGAASPGAVHHVYATTPGDGPRVLPASEALSDPITGLPHTLGVAAGFDKGL